MANPPSPSELKRKVTNIIDDDVSILRKAKRKLVLDRLPRRIPIKIEDLDPAVLEERHNRGLKAVSDPTKYYAKTFKPRVLKREPTELDAVLKFRREHFNSDEQKSKSTDANYPKDHVSDDRCVLV